MILNNPLLLDLREINKRVIEKLNKNTNNK